MEGEECGKRLFRESERGPGMAGRPSKGGSEGMQRTCARLLWGKLRRSEESDPWILLGLSWAHRVSCSFELRCEPPSSVLLRRWVSW
jgi:hypothetical protein